MARVHQALAKWDQEQLMRDTPQMRQIASSLQAGLAVIGGAGSILRTVLESAKMCCDVVVLKQGVPRLPEAMSFHTYKWSKEMFLLGTKGRGLLCRVSNCGWLAQGSCMMWMAAVPSCWPWTAQVTSQDVAFPASSQR